MLRHVFALALLAGLAPAAHAQQFVPQPDSLHPRVEYADGKTSINDRCAVARNKLSLSVSPVYVNGQPVAFCCTACPEKFSNDPSTYLKDFTTDLTDPVHPKQKAVIDAEHVGYVNHDIFFFADDKSKAAFLANPTKYAKGLTDPISRNRFTPTAKSPKMKYEGRTYVFENPETFAAFKATPSVYALRKGA